jgi:dTDP-glucose pyrophosphorylase
MLKNRTIISGSTVLEALKKMDEIDKKLLIVIDNGKFAGLLSAGDIQRAIIQNISLEMPIEEVIRKDIRIASPEDTFDDIKAMMFNYRMELCPVVNSNHEILSVYFWEDVFQEKKLQPGASFNLPVVIMAGGLGSRLKPLTNVLPKPLIPIGNKTMLEEIFDRFHFHGCDQFYVSINYKADLIEYYISKLNLPYKIEFFREEKPNGTAGSLSLLKGKIHKTFFVSNCDILIDQDNNKITIVAALKHLPIPYGTIETGENGQLITLTEKPELTFKINSGMYVLEPEIIDDVPQGRAMDITQLIEKANRIQGKVGVFPVSSKSWIDVGSWSEIARFYNHE